MNNLEKEVSDYLNEISCDLLNKLRESGIKGRPKDSQQCPVAKLLKLKFPDYFVKVWGDECCLRQTSLSPGISVVCPDAIGTFVDEFDNGLHKEFIDE